MRPKPIILCLVCLLGAGGNVTAQTTKPVAGVYYQPVGNFALVQAQGVNALFGYDSGPNKTDTMDAWCASANKAGLRYFLQCFKTSTPGAGARCSRWRLIRWRWLISTTRH